MFLSLNQLGVVDELDGNFELFTDELFPLKSIIPELKVKAII
jgi:hypothetical protein